MNLIDELTFELSKETGLRVNEDWTAAIRSALEACPVEAASSAHAHRKRVLADVARLVTVPETHFFRNYAQLAFCSEHAERVSQGEQKSARVWCAGSATGEEPYTVAMILAQRLGAGFAAHIEISASDINPAAIEKAREAIYTSWSFRGAPGWCLTNFVAASSGHLRLSRHEIREGVTFENESLQAGVARRATGSLDVIFFRNVGIYLEEAALEHLYREFARLLRPGAVLALGPSDPRPQIPEFTFLDYHDDSPIFVRRAASLRPERVQREPAPVFRRLYPPVVSVSAEPSPAVAVDVIRSVTSSQPEDTIAQRILGQMHLERGETQLAVSALRQAVFLDGRDALSRYFYAMALRENGEIAKANRQLENVKTELSARPVDERLSDETTSVGELLQSAEFLGREWC